MHKSNRSNPGRSNSGPFSFKFSMEVLAYHCGMWRNLLTALLIFGASAKIMGNVEFTNAMEINTKTYKVL